MAAMATGTQLASIAVHLRSAERSGNDRNGSTVCGKKNREKTFARSFFEVFWPWGRPHAQTKNRGDRDLSVVKLSAPCDDWSSKNEK